jgi:lysozyme
VSEQPPESLPGIDVSHWQGTIDWAQVAASGQRFVISKASEGQNYVDPMYAINKAEATAAGLAFTAYHFAKPDDTPNDAVLEADHFVDTAQLAPGNLIPALDVERTGGLSQTELTDWILAWLGEVTARLGTKPMVYTSPHGWENRTGDTTAVADAGYTVLWVAHWGVDTPLVPANDWQGNGWTFWQYSDCGTVPGITGCVDTDWYGSASFDPVTIPSPDVTPPTASLTAPTGVAGAVTVAFDEVVHQVSSESLVLRVLDTGADVTSTRTCLSGKETEVDCSTGNVRTVTVQPTGLLVTGQSYASIVNPAGAPTPVEDRSGNLAPPTEQDFTTPAAVEQGSPAVSYGWRSVSKDEAYGGSYAVEHREGATASFSFSGRSVTWYTATGPTQGKAQVLIDGRSVGTFDQYSPSMDFKVARAFTGLERGSHVIEVRVLGHRSSAATDALVVVDAFEAGGDLVKTPALATTWAKFHASHASGGSVAQTDLARASLTFVFRGAGVEWTTVRGPRQGRAEIWVDGALVRTVDNYAPDPAYGVVRSVTGLADGVHTLRIVVLGEGRPKASGVLVSADRFSAVAATP